MFCPFFPLALAFVAGLLFAAHRPWPPGIGVPLLVLALALGWRFFAQNRLQAAAVCALAAAGALGAVVYSADDARFAGNSLSGLPVYSYVDLYGTVVRSLSPGIDRDFLILHVSRVSHLGRETAADGRVRIAVAHSTVSAGRPDILVGDELRVSAQIVPPKEYRNFEEPFSRRYLRSQGFQALAATKSPALITIVRAGPRYSPRRIVSRLRRSFLRRLETAFGASDAPGGILPEGAVLEAFLLGERGRVGDDINRTLQETGLLHILAISGAHIGIIAALLFALLRTAGISRRPASACLIILLLLYALLIEGQASVSRAVLMSVLYFSGGLLWKDVHLLNTLGLSALIILLDNPFQIFDMGFVLTYAATLFILLFFDPLIRRLPKLPLKIPETLAMSISAQAGVLPLVAASFHRITFSGLLLNFLAIPIATILLAAGYLFLPLSFLGGGVLRIGAAVLRLLTDAFIWSTRLLEGWPGLSFRVPAPPLWVCVGYWIALLILLIPERNRAQKAMTTAAGTGFLLLLAFYPYSIGSPGLRLTFLDVGHGDSILVEFPGREKWLVDGGGLPVGGFDIGENVVSPFLWSKGIRRMETLVLSHPHPDHRNGLAAVARNFRVREFWEAAPGASDEGAEALLRALGSARHRLMKPGDERTIGGVRVEVLAPAEDDPIRAGAENERSLVLRLTYGATVFLLAGDIAADAERRLAGSGRDLRATVLKSPHHGSRSSSSMEFLDAVSPEIVVISVGRNNRYGLPHADVVARYDQRGVRVLRTDRDGAVEIRSDGVRTTIRTAVPAGGAIDRPEVGDYHLFMRKRIPALFGLIAVICTVSFGQDLVEAAKKEKERRDARKGVKVVAITNQTLSDLKKKPSVPVVKPEAVPDAGGVPAVEKGASKPAAGTAALPGPEPESPGAPTREQQKAEYQDGYERAKERLDLLGLKLLSLRQQLTTFNSMQSKEKVQKDFAETYQKFLQAQADAAKAKEDLDRSLGGGAGFKPPSPGIK